MSVPFGKRKESQFETLHHYFQLRDDVNELLMNQFGYSEERYRKSIEKFREASKNNPNVEDVVRKKEEKCQFYKNWFIEDEIYAISKYLRDIGTELIVANSIYPSSSPAKVIEYLERRHHITKSITYCYALKQEINYVIRSLPVDINKFERFDESINKQIALLKGMRKSANKFISGSDNTIIDNQILQVLNNVCKIMSMVIGTNK